MPLLKQLVASNCSKEKKFFFTVDDEGIASLGSPLATAVGDCNGIPKSAKTDPFGFTPIKLMVKTLNREEYGKPAEGK